MINILFYRGRSTTATAVLATIPVSATANDSRAAAMSSGNQAHKAGTILSLPVPSESHAQ
eukprot:6196547-Pleurochrysis_carterae.AAC.1